MAGIQERIARIVSPRFLRFVLVGGMAAVVNVVSRVVISNFVRFEIAVLLAFPIALTFAFSMSRLFVFERSGLSIWAQYSRFLIVNLVALIQVWVVSVLLANWIFPAINYVFHAELLAHAIAVASPIFTSYYAHRIFTFRRS